MRKPKPLLTYEDVKEKALRLLEFRSHSEFELRTKLHRADASEENIEKVLEFCRRYGFVNDKSYAERKAKDLINLKKYGIHRIKSELKAKGISDIIIQEVLAEIDTDSEQETLMGLVGKKLKNDFSDKNKDRCIRYFIYRGYNIYDIKNAINTVKERSECPDES